MDNVEDVLLDSSNASNVEDLMASCVEARTFWYMETIVRPPTLHLSHENLLRLHGAQEYQGGRRKTSGDVEGPVWLPIQKNSEILR